MGPIGERTSTISEILGYFSSHPTAHKSEVAAHFAISQYRLSQICGGAVQWTRGGRPPKARTGETGLQHEWETKLHDFGLGMERGLRIHKQRILYGYDPLKQSRDDGSATSP